MGCQRCDVEPRGGESFKPSQNDFDWLGTGIGAEAHERVMARLTKMTPAEIFQTSVDAGIHNPDGTLTKHYAPSKKRK